MKRVLSLVVPLALLFTPGCMIAPVVPPGGLLYTNVSAPLDTDAEESNVGQKSGMASASSILGLVAWGDASTTAAAQNGGITTVEHLDYRFLSVLGIFQKYTTIARGK